VDAAVRHVLWYGVTCHPADAGNEQCLRCGCSSPSCTVVGVTCHPADAGNEQCLRCGCSSPSCTVVLCAADVDGPLQTACKPRSHAQWLIVLFKKTTTIVNVRERYSLIGLARLQDGPN